MGDREWFTNRAFYLAQLSRPTPRPPQQALRAPNDLKLRPYRKKTEQGENMFGSPHSMRCFLMTAQCSISRLQIKKHKGDFRASRVMLALAALRPQLPQQVPAPSPTRSSPAHSPQQLWPRILQPSSDGDQPLPTIFCMNAQAHHAGRH